MGEPRFATRRMLFTLFENTLIISASRRLTRLNTHSVSRRAPSIPFLLLISIGCLPSSLWGRRRNRSGFCRLLPLLRARMFATWRARSRAWPPKYTQTIGIWRASRARQEVTKRRRQVRSVFEKFFDLCKDFGLSIERQGQASDSS
jgi:hypothetical protein